MYSEKTTIVDVVSLGDDGFSLSITASDLYDAAKSGDVIRRHDISTDAGVHNWAYVGLSEVKLDSNGYTFTFSNGDAFSASADDDYPTSETMSDETGGSGGGALIVNGTYDDATSTITLDKTWTEIKGAPIAVVSAEDLDGIKTIDPVIRLGTIPDFSTGTTMYFIDVVLYGETMDDTLMARFAADSEDGVLTFTYE